MRKIFAATAAAFFLVFCGQAFETLAQTGNAQLGGIVQDPTNALIPGVTVTATNIDTNVASTTLTNEAGAYSFPSLLPGSYRVTAELKGFQTYNYNDVRLPYAGQVRIDFTLQIGAAEQTVEVTVAADSILRESSASVGDVLTVDRVMNLPLVGNNVFDLLNTLPGLNISPEAERLNTIGGLGIDTINVTRDGLSTVDGRVNPQNGAYPNAGYRLFSSTLLLPDLVGEIRLIMSPADAELGRGNSQIQISTRSGTNRYNGSVTWNIRNSALDANTWDNNQDGDPLPWRNNHQYTISYGGPVQIPGLYNGKNKTFFFALWEQNISNARDTTNINVLTDTARQGIFRYFTGYNPTGFNPSAAVLNATFPLNAAQASWVAVDADGNPVAPPFNPNGTPYTGELICFSVFGNRRLDANGNMVPFTQADCPWGRAVLGPSAGGTWDSFRPGFDTTGYIRKILDLTPRPNYFGSGDGLNIAQYRFQRRRGGSNSNEAIVGADLYANNKQFNIKFDHHFNANHKAAFSYTTQRDNSADNVAQFPSGGINGAVIRRPYIITANVTSTLSPTLVNEARFGLNHNYNFDVFAWFHPDSSIRERAEEFLLRGGQSVLNPQYTYLAVVNNGVGNINNSNGPMATAGTNILQFNDLWNYADTLSWTKGKHAFKFGGEVRLPRTSGNGGLQPYPFVTLGNASNTATPNPWAGTTTFATELPGLLNAAPAFSGVTASRTNVANLLYYLSGSVSSVSHPYWVNSFDNVNSGLWSDYSTSGDRLRKQIHQEWAAFIKDDYKITRRLTLNLGIRWEYVAAPYIDGGFTATVLDYGYGAFGATRTSDSTLDKFNEDPFSLFMTPGDLYLTGYGSSATNPLSCQRGVQQNPLLPVSTCDPSSMSSIQFVGPGSPNPDIKAMPVNYYNFGPAVGFAYQVPWFGEGKTTIRGGYQQTFGGAGRDNGALGGTESEIANAPGATHTATTVVSDPVLQNILATRAITLADVPTLVPVRPTITPGAPIPIYGRAVNATVRDPNYRTPYAQNVNLSVTRQVTPKIQVDVRYVGTFSRHQEGILNLNTPNVYHNPELFQALTDARAGKCTPSGYPSYIAAGVDPCNINGDPVILDQLLAGLNLNTNVANFGPVGTVNSQGVFQTGAQHLRRSTTFQNSLAWGDFNAVASSLLTLAPTAQQGRQPAPINPATGGTLTGISMIGLRNGCDRIANGFTIVQQTAPGGPQVASSGAPIPLRCFPENWLISNPQLNMASYRTNLGHTNYHSLQVGFTVRNIKGISSQATWVWAKSMQQPTSGFFDPANRHLNFGMQNINAHSLRMNGTFELPIGPGKPFFGNASGWVARVLERWQTSFIANLASGIPASISPAISHFYASSRYNVHPGWVRPKGKVEWNVVNPTTGAITGSFYGNPSPFMGVTDPQCFDPNVVTQGDRMGTNLSGFSNSFGNAVCTIFALAKRNPDGTQGEYLLTYPMPGQVGNSGNNNITYFGQWSLDMNLSKSFRVSETKSFQIRVDATNVLNHPVPNTPTLSVNNLGAINGKGDQRRQLQGQLRINF